MERRFRSSVTRKGQVTIPIELRRRFGIAEGDRVEFSESDSGIRLEPCSRSAHPGASTWERSAVLRTAGILHVYAGSAMLSDEERQIVEDEAAAEGWTERERRRMEHATRDA